MKRDLRWRQLEDQPIATSVDVRVPKDLAEERLISRSVVTVDDEMHAVDHACDSMSSRYMPIIMLFESRTAGA